MKSTNLMWFTAVTLFAALALPVQLAAQQTTRYTITFLGTLGGSFSQPFGMNNRGDVDGIATLPGDNEAHAFFWRKGVITDIGTLGGQNSNGDFGVPFGPNERGEVVGIAETSAPNLFGENFCFGAYLICAPFVWRNGLITRLPTLGGPTGLATDINNRGQIVGMAENTTPAPLGPDCFFAFQFKPVLWQHGRIQEIQTLPGDTYGQATAINELDQVTGGMSDECSLAAVVHGFLWQNGQVRDLGNLGGQTFTNPQAINNRGQVVGSSDLMPGDPFPGHAFLWTKDTGIQYIGTLPGDVSSLAKGINDKNQVVGQSCDANESCRAFLWQNGVMTDLNTLVPSAQGAAHLGQRFRKAPSAHRVRR